MLLARLQIHIPPGHLIHAIAKDKKQHTWVKIKPCLKSTYLPSMSPAMAFEVASLAPATLKVTLEGVKVLTSSEVPWMG